MVCLRCSRAHLVLTVARQGLSPFQMMTLKFRETQELGLKNQAKPKCPNFKVVDLVL